MDDLPVEFDTTRTRAEHIADHERLHRQGRGAVYAAHYQSIHDALADALTKHRPLVLSPGAVYETAITVTAANIAGLRIIGNGATIRATADLDCLLDLNGIAYSKIDGLNLTTADGIAVQDMIRYRWDGQTARSTTNNAFERVFVRGRYVNGWRIGEPGSAAQCDKTLFRQCGAAGSWTPGETTLWQRGFIVGDGTTGNCMLHRFEMCDTVQNRVHYEIDRAGMVTISGSGSIAEVDVIAHVYGPLTLEQYRSEGSAQFLSADVGGATFPMQITIDRCGFHPSIDGGLTSMIRPDGHWIEVNYGGALSIRQTIVRPTLADVPTVIYGRNLQRPLWIEARGLVVANTAQADAFDVTGATVDCAGYEQIDSDGRIVT